MSTTRLADAAATALAGVMSEQHILLDFEHAVERLRFSLRNHPMRIAVFEEIQNLIAVGKKLVDARAAADAKAATESARAEKAEADLVEANAKIADFEQQIAAAEDSAKTAAAELQAEIDRETSDTVAGGADTVSGSGADTIIGGHGNDAIVSGEAEAHQG